MNYQEKRQLVRLLTNNKGGKELVVLYEFMKKSQM